MNGQNYHRIGTLLPEGKDRPRWAQLYICDTENEVRNRIKASKFEDKMESIDAHIVEELKICWIEIIYLQKYSEWQGTDSKKVTITT